MAVSGIYFVHADFLHSPQKQQDQTEGNGFYISHMDL